jgi:hypothetical protein
VIGKLNYLAKSASNIAISAHPCDWYMSKTMRIHGEAARQIGRYLLGTRDKSYLVDQIPSNHLNAMLMQNILVTGILCIQKILTCQNAEQST